MNVLFVCTGNICRSPMAEGLLRHRWEALGRNDLNVSSMGIHGLDHQPASEFAQQVCMENGIDISEHRSRPLTYVELKDTDIVLALEQGQKEYIKLFFPGLGEKVFTLAAWPGKETRKSNVKDPIGGSLKLYRQVYSLIDQHIERIIPYLIEFFG